MANMAYVYIRDSDGVVVGVFAEQQTLRDGHTEFFEDWPKGGSWVTTKYTRAAKDDYTNTRVEHTDETGGLM